MFKFSRPVDYALVALAHLALEGAARPIPVKEIAETYRLPRPLLSNILKRLCREGLVASVRGVRGGYRLARPPSEITLGGLLRAIEGPIRLTLCSAPDSGPCCARSKICPVRAQLRRFQSTVQGILDRASLADLSARRRPGPSASD